MEEQQLTQEQLLKKSILMNKIKIISNIVLILLGIGIAWYMISNVELLKILNQDVCKLCMNKTGAVCYKPLF